MSNLKSSINSQSPLLTTASSANNQDKSKNSLQSQRSRQLASVVIRAPGSVRTDQTSNVEDVDDGSQDKATTELALDASPISNTEFSDLEDFDDTMKNDTEERLTVNLPDADSKIQESDEPSSTKQIDDSSTKEKHVTDENFSDWSEDEDDELLKYEATDDTNIIAKGRDGDSLEDVGRSSFRQAHDTTVSPVPDDDLEPVSDDDLDAMIGDSGPLEPHESQSSSNTQRQMLDSLEIDWASLVSTSIKEADEQVSRSARERCSAANLFSEIGFSQAYAGEVLTKQVIEFCQKEQEDKFTPFMHPIASVHCFLKTRQRERRNLFKENDEKFSTALSARKDLHIRELLSRRTYPIVETNQD